MRPIIALVFLLVLLPVAPRVHAGDDADRDFRDLYEREWAFRLQEFPSLAFEAGETAGPDRFEDVGAEARQRRLKYWRGVKRDLDPIDRSKLSASAQVNAIIFADQIDQRIADLELGGWQMPLNSDSSFFSAVAMMPDRQPVSTRAQVDRYLKRLVDMPRYFEQQIANMRLGLKRGMTVPKVVLGGRDQAAAAHAQTVTVQDSVFYRPLTRLPESWPETVRMNYQKRARRIIAEAVQPAYANVRDFLRDEYIPGARSTIAAHALPEGKAYYRAQIREYTTLDLEPEAIHAIGQREVARIRGEMQTIIDELDFDGDFAEFLAFLRSDSQFYAKTPDELLMHARDIAKRIDAELPRYFGALPRRPYGVAPVPAAIAPFYTAGRYAGAPEGSNEPGWYWVNTYNLSARPLYALPALTLHEAVPGHHLQAALAEEQDEQPAFRRTSYISAYGEGWGLYAEWLGKEMGIYRTPYEDFGRLTYEMWRACRLVVDTGMHAMDWSRDRALTFMRDNTALSEHEITTEIDRYISWPGQALAYKLGEIRIRELRAKAERELGERFDLRAFHDTVLALGSVPLSVLDVRVDAWIEQHDSDSP